MEGRRECEGPAAGDAIGGGGGGASGYQSVHKLDVSR
jgi:hypothetical protein